MKHYLFELDGDDYQNRLLLESWYAKKDKKVPFATILRELMAEKVASISPKKR